MLRPIQQPGGIDQASPGFIWPGIVYFGLVFAVGFLLGTIRVLLIVPVLGERLAELSETPLMLLAIFISARWVVRRFRIPPNAQQRICIGLTGLVLMLLAEWSVVQFIRNETIGDYIAGRDPLAGSVYLASLVVFVLMPWLLRVFGNLLDHSDSPDGANEKR